MKGVELELLRNFLAGRDVECPQCRYNLRDLTGDRCPECGEQLVLRINLAEPKLAGFVVGLVGLAAGAGMSGLLIPYVFIQILIRRLSWNSPDIAQILMVCLPGVIVEGLAILIWVRLRSRVRQLPTGKRIVCVAACWLLTLINLVAFSLLIR